MIKPFLSGIFAGLLSLSSVSAHAEENPVQHLNSGNYIYDLMKGSDIQQSIAAGYIVGFYEALDEKVFCAPVGFHKRQAYDIAKRAFEEFAELRHMPATMILQVVFEKKFPCKESKKPSSSKNGKDV